MKTQFLKIAVLVFSITTSISGFAKDGISLNMYTYLRGHDDAMFYYGSSKSTCNMPLKDSSIVRRLDLNSRTLNILFPKNRKRKHESETTAIYNEGRNDGSKDAEKYFADGTLCDRLKAMELTVAECSVISEGAPTEEIKLPLNKFSGDAILVLDPQHILKLSQSTFGGIPVLTLEIDGLSQTGSAFEPVKIDGSLNGTPYRVGCQLK